VQNGIPDTETLTVFAAGREWVDQQWLAQTIFYGVDRAFGLQGVALLHVLVFGLTVASWMAGARLLGASAIHEATVRPNTSTCSSATP